MDSAFWTIVKAYFVFMAVMLIVLLMLYFA
jgi:hypothetical protein